MLQCLPATRLNFGFFIGEAPDSGHTSGSEEESPAYNYANPPLDATGGRGAAAARSGGSGGGRRAHASDDVDMWVPTDEMLADYAAQQEGMTTILAAATFGKSPAPNL